LSDSGAQAWLGELPEQTEGLPHVPVRLHARSWHRYAEPSPDAVAMVMYTSGTTGPPKGVLISRRAIATDVDALAAAWAWTPDDTLVHGLPLFHVHGLILGLLGSLRIGNRLVHTGKPSPAAYAEAAGSLYFGVPTVWSRIAGDLDAASTKACMRDDQWMSSLPMVACLRGGQLMWTWPWPLVITNYMQDVRLLVCNTRVSEPD
jgi:fatty acid CoA ligase FadD36